MMIGLSKNYFVTCLLLLGCARTLGITLNKKDAAEFTLNARNIGRALAQCFSQNQKLECFKIKVMHILEAALQDNSTWHYGDFVLVEKNENELNNHSRSWTTQQQQRSISDRIGIKLLQLAQTRSIRLKVPKRMDLTNLESLGAGISDAVDDINEDLNAVVGDTNVVEAGPGDDNVGDGGIQSADEGRKKKHKTNKNKIWYLYHPKQKTLKGRKKKDKDKTLAIMGGMTVVAMMAQMFLGKVILIAGASFVIAKVALLISLLTSIKNKAGGGHGSDHVIVTGGGHSHGHESSGWHRSMPYDYPKIEELHDDEPDIVTHPLESEHEPSTHSEYGPPSHSDHGSSNGHRESTYYSHKFSEHDSAADDFDRRAGFLKI